MRMLKECRKVLRNPGLILSLIIGFMIACSPLDEDISTESGLIVSASTDTIFFDTLVSETASITRRFKIRNPNRKAVTLDEVRLGRGNASAYSMIVNGRTGDSVEDLVIFGGDSIQILVEVFIDTQDEDLAYLVKDSIVYSWNGNTRDVKLIAYGQDANFINRDTLCDATWASTRPYVILDYVYVPAGCSLTVESGATILMDNGAAMLIEGQLFMNGAAEEKITVRNSRLDEGYDEAPGQWDAIYFLEGSSAQIEYADIINGTIGLRIGTPDPDSNPDLIVNNSTIGHMSSAAIAAFTSDVQVTNSLFFNCGDFLVGNFAGGELPI